MILEEILPSYWDKRKSRIFHAPFGFDRPKNTPYTTSDRWHSYPIQDYSYKFNSWAFRGQDYEQYKNQPVNICLGDSFTLNIGGPEEHSWPAQLADHFKIPTLNFGVDGSGNDTIRIIYEYLIKQFDVQNTFVMYSFFHRRYNKNKKKLLQVGCLDDLENFSYFEENKIKNCYYTFIPPWCWSDEETQYITDFYGNHLLSFKDFDSKFLNKNRVFFTSIDQYNKLKGQQWPTYKEFINDSIIDNNIYQEIFYSKTKYDLFYIKNRDGYHLNYIGNKIVCNYFLSQINCTPNV